MAYKLVSFDLCPFVQRSVITLQEKGVAHEVAYIDLSAKPEWFKKISPFGKVPLLLVDDTVLFESAVINEYLDEVTGGGMHPKDPLERAQHRGWIEVASALSGDVYVLMTAKSEEEVRRALDKAHDKLSRLEAQVRGPFFSGEAFRLVDAAFAPMLQRLVWCDRVAPDLGLWAPHPKARAYADAMLARPSVQRSIVTDAESIFRDYLRGRGSPTRNVEPSWLGRNP